MSNAGEKTGRTRNPTCYPPSIFRRGYKPISNLDPYTFTDDVAKHFASDDENHQQTAEEILLTAIDGLTDDKLTGFALRLALTGHTGIIPHENEFDFLSEAEAALVLPTPKKEPKRKATKTATPNKRAAKKSSSKKKAA